MNRILATLSVTALLAAATTAQCLNTSSPGTLIGIGDDTYFATHYSLGFSFPMVNSALGSYTNFRVSCNGWLILTNGTTTPTVGVPASYGSVASVLGATGAAPILMPFARDLNLLAANSAGLYYDNTSNPGVSCTITWVNAVDYSNLGAPKSFQVELFATGEIKYSYSSPANVAGASSMYCCVSTANGVVDPGQSDLSATPVTTADAIYQIFPTGPVDLGGSQILFTPIATGGWVASTNCQVLAASNTNYGTGCYSSPATGFYEAFSDAAVASAGLQGNALQLTMAGNGYVATWLAGGSALYVPPTGLATSLPVTDDGDTLVTPTSPLTVPGGVATQITVSHNGIITLGGTANDSFDYTPTGPEFAAQTGAAFYSWHDYNDSEAGSGTIKTEEVGGVLYITWDSVESYPATSVAPSTIQFQLNLATGSVNYVWVTVATDTTSTFGSVHLVGYKGIGTVVDGGSVDLTTALPAPFVHNPLLPLAMSASPAPVSTAGSGTLVTYAVSNIPESAPASGFYFGVTVISLTPNPVGTDLTFLGAPGCNLYVGSLDLLLSFIGTTPSQTTQFAIPAAVAYGTQIYATSAALFMPGSLPNGQNPGGLVTSNGVASFISAF